MPDQVRYLRTAFSVAAGAVLGLTGATPARAFELSFVGGLDFATPAVLLGGVNAGGYSSKPAIGGGMLLGFDLCYAVELEVGALYMGRHFDNPATSSATGSTEHNYSSYEVPVVLRLVPLKYITFGAGPYYASPTGQDSSAGVPATSHFKGDLGFLGSLGLKLPLNLAASFLVDTRYYYGVTNASTDAGQTLHYRDVQVLAGLNFGF